MATVTNWIDHLNKPAEEVAGAVYPGAGLNLYKSK